MLHSRGGLGRLAAWHLPAGKVGAPARWATTSNVEGWSGTEEGGLELFIREGGLSSDKLFAGVPSSSLRHCSWGRSA